VSTSAQTLGRYQIIREIARSNDIVYEGYDPAMNRRVAVKELVYPNTGTDAQREDRLRRFLREAKAAGSLTHPNIVTIYEVGEDQGRNFIAMEYLEGRSLRERLDSDGSVPLEESVRIMGEVLDALQYAHQHGVIHRDVKPDNIHLLSDGRVKLTDFGIARLTFEQSITLDGQVFGTPSYMSPEQVVGRDLDARTDIFSAGVVLYEMMTGAKPFTGDSVVTVTYNICNVDPVSPPGTPYPVEAVIRKALEKSVSLRFGSASEMRSALKEAITQPAQGAGATYGGPSPYIPQGIIPGIAPPSPSTYSGAGATPPPYTGPMPQAQQSQFPSVHTPPPTTVWLPPPPRPLFSPRTKQMVGSILLTGRAVRPADPPSRITREQRPVQIRRGAERPRARGADRRLQGARAEGTGVGL
jgi:serine/threonine-protein kinase